MAISVVRLGSPRRRGEGVRVGTVRRPPRGVRAADFAKQSWYDVWLPNLAPSAALLRTVRQADSETAWRRFARRYRAEMKRPDAAHVLNLLVALSQTTDLSVGCYCSDERRCHRSILRELLVERGADVRL